jgi:hypothetical protein
MTSPVPVPQTAHELFADERWGNNRQWRNGEGKTFYQLCEEKHGADKTALMWWDAILLDVARLT